MKKSKVKKAKKKRILVWFLVPLFLAFCIASFVVVVYKFDPELLTQISFYVELANPNIRIARIEPGARKEEIALALAKTFNWSASEQKDFIGPSTIAQNTTNNEGKYFPKTYLIDKDANPEEVRNILFTEYEKQIKKVSKSPSKAIINKDTITTIASIIEREASKNDRTLVSGIIWNRIFAGKNLEMDATVQYAKGNAIDGWWQKVSSADIKKFDSPYNTYLHKGLPPGAIANPSIESIYAAYNPEKTDCMFYLHDTDGIIHCSATYAGHQANINKYYPKKAK